VKARKAVPLEKAKFLAQRGDTDAEKEEDKQIEKQANGGNTIKRDFFMNELLNIANDYYAELGNKKLVRK